MTTSIATVLALLPRSDEKLAQDIGISAKTIKRIKKGNYEPSEVTKSQILDYLDRLGMEIIKFVSDVNNIPTFYETSDLPLIPKYLSPEKRELLANRHRSSTSS